MDSGTNTMLAFPLPEQEKDYLRRFHSIFHSEQEANQYLYDSWQRIQVVLEWMSRLHREGVRDVLELGSNPYFLTLLLRRHFDFRLHLANFFGDRTHNGEQEQTVASGEEEIRFSFHHFNLEVDPFPYQDASIDCVIFCEILEHLLLNPDFSVSEMKRILRPGGYLIVSTPNAARLANLVRLFRGKNIYDGYSVYGIYGRHNREYTPAEVIELLHRHSFEVIDSKIRNIYPHPFKTRALQALRPNTWYEHIFVMGRKK